MTPQPNFTNAHQPIFKELSRELQNQHEAWLASKRRAKLILEESDRNFIRYWQANLNNMANMRIIRIIEKLTDDIEMKSQLPERSKNLFTRIINGYKYSIIGKKGDISSIYRALQTSEDQKDSYLVEISGLFDASWYLSKNEDVRQAGVDPLGHYMTFGWKEGRNPCAIFNTNDYLNENGDVAAAGANPLVHFIRFGVVEGRGPIKKTLSFIRSGAM